MSGQSDAGLLIERDPMSRIRLHIDGPLSENTEIELTGDPAHYIGRVLRLGPHDQLTLFDGRGGEYPATILSVGRNNVRVSVDSHVDRNVESSLAIHLLQGISRGDRMDFVVQKVTELGVQRITPVITEYSVVKLEPKRAEKRLHHWRGISASACEQSGRNALPAIEAPLPLRTWIGENFEESGARVILKPGGNNSIRSVGPKIDRLVLLIGPEGGFSDAEYELAEATGFRAIGFGKRILRTETAAVAAIAALQALYGDLA
jgi:16S rRNA (uracil1498-N3)-methyltransferase